MTQRDRRQKREFVPIDFHLGNYIICVFPVKPYDRVIERRRERKKRETGERIARAAAELFAEREFDVVSVRDVADAADVSEQTVYNHFPTKEDLVFDRSADLDRALREAIVDRPAEMPAATAIRPVLHALLERTAQHSLEEQRGGLARLSTDSPALQRVTLERTRGHATTISAALAKGRTPTPELMAIGWALAGVLQLVIEELGSAQRRGEDPAVTAKRLRSDVDRQLKRLAVLG
jgi:AcrR family transcriptional regulator